MSHPTDIELLCLDVDGVLTDGGIRLDDRGVETRRFHVHDGRPVGLVDVQDLIAMKVVRE